MQQSDQPLSLIAPGLFDLGSPNDERGTQRRVGKVVGYPDSFEDLPGKWQPAILKAEQNRPRLRVIIRD